MDSTNYPPSVILTIVVLSFMAIISSQAAALVFGQWAAVPSGPFPTSAIFYLVGMCLVPVLAIIDIFKRKRSGQYLALFSLMIWLGLVLRGVSYQVTMPVSPANVVVWAVKTYAACAVLLANMWLIYRLGFGKRANEFFGQFHPALARYESDDLQLGHAAAPNFHWQGDDGRAFEGDLFDAGDELKCRDVVCNERVMSREIR